jgi:hypothetical protein
VELKEGIERILNSGGEIFIKARDKGHAESMRVSAFNIRRRLPSMLKGSIGIQAVAENGEHFLRLFDREIDGAEVFVRDKETGKLIPAPKSGYDPELQRMIDMMKRDGKTDDEIAEYMKGE